MVLSSTMRDGLRQAGFLSQGNFAVAWVGRIDPGIPFFLIQTVDMGTGSW